MTGRSRRQKEWPFGGATPLPLADCGWHTSLTARIQNEVSPDGPIGGPPGCGSEERACSRVPRRPTDKGLPSLF
jgi:hypothetical protein